MTDTDCAEACRLAACFDGTGDALLQEWNLHAHPLCSERLQWLWLPFTTSMWKNA